MAAPEPGTPAPEPVAPIVSDWTTLRTSLPTDLRDHPSLGQYGEGDAPSGFAGLVKDHLEVQKLVGGDKVTKPGADADIQDYARFYKELGRPDGDGSSYDLGDFAPPEGVPWDNDLQAGLMQDLYDSGASEEMANKLLRKYTDRTAGAYKDISFQLQEHRAEAQAALKTEWGAGYDANHELAERVFATAFGEEVDGVAQMELTDGTMVGDNPVFIRGMYEIAKRMEEGSFIEGLAPKSLSLTPDAAQAEIDAMERDPIQTKILTTQSHPENKALRAKANALYKAANPE
jgi:hypothetical protein